GTVSLWSRGGRGRAGLARAHYRGAPVAAARLEAAGVALPFNAPFFNEFVVRAPAAARAWEALARDGVVAGFPLGRWYPELEGGLLLCVTETHTPEQVDRLVEALAAPAPA